MTYRDDIAAAFNAVDRILDGHDVSDETVARDLKRANDDLAATQETNRITTRALTFLKAEYDAHMATHDPRYLPGWGIPAWDTTFSDATVVSSNYAIRTRTDLGLGIDAGIPSADCIRTVDGRLSVQSYWLSDAPRTRTPSESGVAILTSNTGYIDQSPRGKTTDKVREARWGRWEGLLKFDTGANTRGVLNAFWLRNRKKGELDLAEGWGWGGQMGGSAAQDKVYQDYLKNSGATTLFGDTMSVNSRIALLNWRKTLGLDLNPNADWFKVAWEMLPERCALVINDEEVWETDPDKMPLLWGDEMDSPWSVRINTHMGPSAKSWGLPDPKNKALTKPLIDYGVKHVRYWAPPSDLVAA